MTTPQHAQSRASSRQTVLAVGIPRRGHDIAILLVRQS